MALLVGSLYRLGLMIGGGGVMQHATVDKSRHLEIDDVPIALDLVEAASLRAKL
jgi:hypothetical protein